MVEMVAKLIGKRVTCHYADKHISVIVGGVLDYIAYRDGSVIFCVRGDGDTSVTAPVDNIIHLAGDEIHCHLGGE